jgi:hypothetical protein
MCQICWPHQICRQEIASKRQVLAKEKEREIERAKAEKERKRNERREKLFARISTVKVNFQDIRETGACALGINTWCKDHNIDPNSSVSLSQLARDVQAYPYALKAARNILHKYNNSLTT